MCKAYVQKKIYIKLTISNSNIRRKKIRKQIDKACMRMIFNPTKNLSKDASIVASIVFVIRRSFVNGFGI